MTMHQEFRRRVDGFYAAMERDLGDGFQLRCEQCGRIQVMQPGDATRYLSNGWPKCHEREMRHERIKEADRE